MRLRLLTLLVVLLTLPACKDLKKSKTKTTTASVDAGAMALDAGAAALTSAAPTPDLPPPAAGKGQLTGTVTWAGDVVPSVEAKLCTKFTSLTIGDSGGCTGATFSAKSDGAGRFVIHDVPPGTYEALLVQVFDSSTYQYAHRLTDVFGASKQEITAGKTTDAGETKLVKSESLVAVPRSMARTSPSPTIRWRAYPRATSYTVRLRSDDRDSRPAITGKSDTPTFVPPAPLTPGRWKIEISALDKNGTAIADDRERRDFIVPDADDKTPLDEVPAADPPAPSTPPARADLPPLTAPADQGAVRGVVLFDDHPMPKIDVRLCETYDPFFSGCGGKILKTKTDVNGAYTFPSVPPKSWGGLTVKGLSGETLYMAGALVGAKTFDVEAGKVLVPSVTNLTKSDLKITAPPKKAKLTTGRFPISWTAYPGAASYSFTLDADDYQRVRDYKSVDVDGTTFTLDKPLADGAYALTVRALNANGTVIAHSAASAGKLVVTTK